MQNTCVPASRGGGTQCAALQTLTVTAARLAASLQQCIASFVGASDQHLGHLETQVAQQAQELLRHATETAAQQKADTTPPRCPVCGQSLGRCSTGHARTFETRFGSITVRRVRGYCKRCRKWRCPADTVLGLEETAGYSPAVQEMAALVATTMPVAEASLVLERLAGVKLPRATLDRAVGRAVFGEDQVQFRAWLKPLAQQLKNQSAVKVIRQLEELQQSLPVGTSAGEVVRREVNYFHEHESRMDYRAGQRRGEPIGSGPVEATCRQSQCRFKRTGQFWSQRGDEALLCLEMLWRNGRWHLLFPHVPHFVPARN